MENSPVGFDPLGTLQKYGCEQGTVAIDNRMQTAENPAMYRALFEQFSARCVGQIWRGEALSAEDSAAFSAYLDAREASPRRLLGVHAGPDASIDTVTGRCGIRPLFR